MTLIKVCFLKVLAKCIHVGLKLLSKFHIEYMSYKSSYIICVVQKIYLPSKNTFKIRQQIDSDSNVCVLEISCISCHYMRFCVVCIYSE